jgi:hypothetical protein
MSDKEIKEEVNDEEQAEAMEDPSNPASELVDLVLSGELHAANEKFNSIAESKVVTAIEDEKLKIAQTLFSEDDDEDSEDDDDDDKKDKKDKKDDDEEVEEGKIPPQFLKKGKDDDSDDDDDDDSDDDDSDSDDDDGDKPKKGKIPHQFMKKEFYTPTLPRLSKSEQERKKKGIPKDKQGKGFQLDTSDDDDDDNKRKSGIMFNQLKVPKENAEPVDELSSGLLGRASDKADKQSQDASHGVGETGKEKDYKKQDTALAKKKGIQSRKFERGAADASNREAIAKNRAIAAQQSKNEDLSFDPGEASANVELPKDSFVQGVANHLSGQRISK